MKQQPIEYHDGEVLLRGELAWDDAMTGPRPGVLVVHEGGGINEHPKRRARQLAELGYVAFACDMFGNGEFIEDLTRRNERMTALVSDTAKLRRRVRLGLETLAAQPDVDRGRLAAIGYCFGGMAVLELVRTGAELAGVVSFHGLLRTAQPAEPGVVRAKVLACHGAEDPLVPPAQVAAFIDEMQRAGVDWQMITYGHAGHGFTRLDAAKMGVPGIAHEPRADARSWVAMKAFFAEIFQA